MMITHIHRVFSRLRSAALRPCFATSLLHDRRGGGISDAGFTLLEIVFAVEVMLLLTLISYNETARVKHYARVAACQRYQGIMQRQFWAGYALDGEFPPDAVTLLNSLPTGAMEKVYEYAVTPAFDQYYLRCQHNHAYVGVLFVDSGAYLLPKPIYALAAARGMIP
jgi:hypothetical protein